MFVAETFAGEWSWRGRQSQRIWSVVSRWAVEKGIDLRKEGWLPLRVVASREVSEAMNNTTERC